MAAKPAWLWAKAFYEACNGGLTGIGTDDEAIINILCQNRETMAELKAEFAAMGGVSLLEEIEEETVDNAPVFQRLIKMLLT